MSDDDRLARIEKQIEGLCSDMSRLTASLSDGNNERPSVGDDNVDEVRKYFKRRRRGTVVRQADITDALWPGNGGLTSLAIRALEYDGEVKRGPKKRRSPTWTYTG